MKENKQVAIIQSNKVQRSWNFSANTFCSQSSKVRVFLSHQRHHIKQCGMAFQISTCLWRPNLPCQHAYRSITRLGITQLIPNRLKTAAHNSLTTRQWRNKWSMVSPLALHIQHQLIKTILHFTNCPLSISSPKPQSK